MSQGSFARGFDGIKDEKPTPGNSDHYLVLNKVAFPDTNVLTFAIKSCLCYLISFGLNLPSVNWEGVDSGQSYSLLAYECK